VTPLQLAHTVDGVASAPVLVLGNSLGTTSELWDAHLESLLAHARVVRWDLPGHGESPSGDGSVTVGELAGAVVLMLDQLGIGPFRYCGVSFGGMVGMAVAAANPGRVERLALCCTAAHLPPAQGWHERAATVRARGMDAIATPVIARWFTPGFPAQHPAVITGLRAAFVAADVEGYARCCEAIAEMDLRASLPSIACPTLVITAADDLAIPPAHGAAIAGAVGARLVCVERAAHLAVVERAATITPLLVDHLFPS
jgi:3-oxoadipate enol-lactonase